LDDNYEGLISPIRGDYGIVNDDTFHLSYYKDESNQSRLGVLEDDKQEDNPNALSPIHETVTKSHCATPFVLLQVKTQSSSHKGSPTHKALHASVVTSSLSTPLITPATFTKAMNSPNCELWWLAYRDKIENLHQNTTFKLVNLPPGKRALGLKWVNKIKLWGNGSFNKCKA
jgi:hypothetical protein